MSYNKNQIVAGVILREGKVLIACRMQKDEDGDLWEFPGGKIETGETPESALHRELQEEMGLKIEIKGKICECEEKDRIFYFYFAISGSSPWKLNSHQEVRWVKIPELSKFKFCQPDQKVLPQIVHFLKGVKIC